MDGTLATTARGRRFGSWITWRRCGRRRSGLPAPLTVTLCWLFCRGRPWIKGQSISSKKTRDLIHYIREVMGFLARNTVAESCKRFRSQFKAVVAADGSLIDYTDSQYVLLPTCVYFNKIGWFLDVLCRLKKTKLKFRIYRCHPVYNQCNVRYCSHRMEPFSFLDYK